MCRIFGWTVQEYEAAPAEMTDWAFAIEAAKAEVIEIMRAQSK